MTLRKRPHFVGVWLSESGLAAIDELARTSGRSRSEMIRVLLSEAVTDRQRVAARTRR